MFFNHTHWRGITLIFVEGLINGWIIFISLLLRRVVIKLSGYKIIRADKHADPGIITEQIIDFIINAELAIIDYTDLNPNVMYEVAIRHLSEKPFIQIHPNGTRLPFDISNLRSIVYDPNDIKYPEKLIDELKKSLNSIESSDYEQPKIVKEKFNLDRVFNDPEKFVELLKKHLRHLAKNKIHA